MVAQEAIVIRNARKRYEKMPPVINDLNMTVPRGIIYGLLGASGCGKTTLLSCVVGVRHLDSGDIWVLGGTPRSKGSGIPGPRVGYMPQEIALVGEFSVLGALYYFGRINGMKDSDIDVECEFLSDLLNLPPKNKLVKQLSGGQQRRVSFAAALIHKPELLILDEPTVGLDPVLREKIWDYLVKITRDQGTTVVITTHYIDEAKQADRIGLLRSGKLLAEASPKQLLEKYKCDTLEEAFLFLSRRQKQNQDKGISEVADEYSAEIKDISVATSSQDNLNSNYSLLPKVKASRGTKGCRNLGVKKLQALMAKNILQFIRHPGGILFAFVFPLVQSFAFFYAVGGDPKGFSLAVINDEAGNCNFGLNQGLIIHNPTDDSCKYIDMSCKFLFDIDDSLIGKKFYNDARTVKSDVRKGEILGYIHFGKNFSSALMKRRDKPLELSDEELLESEIQVSLDMGNRQTGLFFQDKLFKLFFKSLGAVLTKCGINPKFGKTPINFETPIAGSLDSTLADFMAGPFILCSIFFLATTVSTAIIITDRHEGIWERSLVQGVTTSEILLCHVITQLFVLFIQVSLTLMVCILYFDHAVLGSMVSVIVLVFMMGFCGLCYGFLISVMCTSHSLANFIVTGTFYPIMLLGGLLWPVEGIPEPLRWVGYFLPTTVPGITLRNIFDRGNPINDPQVYSGFLVIVAWSVGLLAICFFKLKCQSK